MQISAQELCDLLGGELVGDPKSIITGPSKIEDGKEGTISFLANPKYEKFVYTTKASVLLVNKSFSPVSEIKSTLIKVEDVYQALGLILAKYNVSEEISKGISEKADLHKSAKIGESTSIGAFVSIGENSCIGNGSKIYANCYIGKNVKIGENTILYPGVRIYKECEIGSNCIIHANAVIGSDGFGFAKDKEGKFTKLQQIGNVEIKDNVEIGANTVIDRATMGSTLISANVKLDNLIQVAHNVIIGPNTAIAAQVGIAGSTKIESDCLIGGQAGFGGHIVVGKGSQVQGQSGVSGSVKPGSKLYGTPAIDYTGYLRSYAIFKKLPEYLKKIEELEKELLDLKKQH